MPLQVSRIHAICFDVDGTLSDTDDAMVAQLSALLKPFHFLFAGKDLTRVARAMIMEAETPASYLFGIPDLIGLDDEIYALKDWIVRRSKQKAKPFLLVSGSLETLEHLGRRYPLAVVSARDKTTTMQFLDQYNLATYFKCIATDQTCEHTKPYPDPIVWAAGQMGVAPQACLMVGDTSVDMRAGKAAGAQSVGVLCGFGEKDELIRHGADLILPAPSDLLNILGD